MFDSTKKEQKTTDTVPCGESLRHLVLRLMDDNMLLSGEAPSGNAIHLHLRLDETGTSG